MRKELRIKKNEEFSELISKKKRVASYSFIVYYDKAREKKNRVGISVSKKLGNAVTRNKIKRQLRMICQSVVPFEEASYDCVIIVRKGYQERSFEENRNDLEKLLKKVII